MSASDKQHGGDHYAKLPTEMQPWNVLKHWLTPEEYRGWQKGVAIVYLARERDKGGDLDIQKAIHHLERLAEEFTDADKQIDLPLSGPEAEKPWYPDDRPGWKEYDPAIITGLEPDTRVEVLSRSERQHRTYRKVIRRAVDFFWGHAVAYRVAD